MANVDSIIRLPFREVCEGACFILDKTVFRKYSNTGTLTTHTLASVNISPSTVVEVLNPGEFICDYGSRWYNSNGYLHRDDGPAVTDYTGYSAWYQNREYHRIGGPARTWPDGSTHWHEYGLLHRTDGPAVDLSNGYKEWWLNGCRIRDELTILLIKHRSAGECANGWVSCSEKEAVL